VSARRPDTVLAALSAALADAGAELVLMGGYAVVVWGVPRATYDVDVLVRVDDMQRCLATLEQHGFGVDHAYKQGWVDRIRDMPLVKASSFRDGRSIASDLFPVTTPLQQSAFARASLIEVPEANITARVISAADLILFKLLADRQKDRLDVQNVLTVQGVPDPEYLTEWAHKLGVEAGLARALHVAGLGPTS
jgi:hypothetical protein